MQDDESDKINVYLHYSGIDKLGVILAVEETKAIRKNELIAFVQKLRFDESDKKDLQNQRTKRMFIDRLSKEACTMVYVDKVQVA